MRRFRLFAIALIVSLALHALLLGEGGWLPDIKLSAPPEKLEPITAKLAAPQLDEQPAAASPAPAAPAPRPTLAEPAAPRPKARHRKQDASAGGDERLARAEASAPARPRTSSNASAPAAQALAASAPSTETARNGADSGATMAPTKRFPAQITVRYRLYWGRLSAGSGEMRWQRNGGRYTLDAFASALIGPKLHYRSEGQIGRHGLVPEHYQAWRDNDEYEAASFDWTGGKLVYGDRDKDKQDTALQRGAQDFVSVSWQLAITGGADLGESLQITNGRKVYRYPLKLAGQAHYPDEKGMTVLVVKSQNEDELTEFWLAPEFNNLPVKIVRIDKKKTIEQRATRIDINGKSVWDLSSRND